MKKRAVVVLFAVCFSSAALMADEKKPVVIEEKSIVVAPGPEAPALLKVMSNGAMSVALDGQLDHRLVAFINENGELELTCTDDHQLAAALEQHPESIMRLRRTRGATAQKERE